MFEKVLSKRELTTLGISGKHWVFFPENEDELLKSLEKTSHFCVLGKGSNVVINENFSLPFISLSRFNKVEISKETIRLGAGVSLKRIMREQIRRNFSLFEFLAGIPATVGGMVAQNAGAYGKEVKDFLVEVVYFDVKERDVKTLTNFSEFSYRKSPFPEKGIVIEAVFRIKRCERIRELIKHFLRKRMETQPPFWERTAGSTFKNPPGEKAGKLLEECGMKGFKLGSLKFSEKHANFLINTGGATFSEFKDITNIARERVEKRFGILLDFEVRIFDNDNDYHLTCGGSG